MAEIDEWNRDHTAELIEVAGQVLTIDMAAVESIDLDLARDVRESGATEDGFVTRELGEMMTIVYIARVRADGVRWA